MNRTNCRSSWRISTTPVSCTADVRLFFDGCARSFSEQHGDPARLLAYRLDLVRRHARLRPDDVVLDVGCGTGHHLLALAPEIARGTGIDLSPCMIDVARMRLAASPWRHRLHFEVGDAAELGCVADRSIDLAVCIGALEHFLDRRAALTNARRILKSGGRFFCLTPDGDYVWYRTLAPLLGVTTKHLSTDVFLTRGELGSLFAQGGFPRVELGSWTFVPKGDMPRLTGFTLERLDAFARYAGRPHGLRGGLWACAVNG